MKKTILIPLLFILLPACADNSGDGNSACTIPYNGSLNTLICDIKRPLSGDASQNLDASNYKRILTALKNKLGCNTIRTFIDMSKIDATTYSQLYKDVFTYAHDTLKLKIYANPLGTGAFGLDKDTFASRVATYTNQFLPDYVGPFNESGWDPSDFIYIADKVRSLLNTNTTTQIVGPDVQKVSFTLAKINSSPQLPQHFDILGAHNAVADESATLTGWNSLAQSKNILWASENPRAWSELNSSGQEVGVQSVLASPAKGLVIYLAFPGSIDVDGNLTPKGQEIANGVRKTNCF